MCRQTRRWKGSVTSKHADKEAVKKICKKVMASRGSRKQEGAKKLSESMVKGKQPCVRAGESEPESRKGVKGR